MTVLGRIRRWLGRRLLAWVRCPECGLPWDEPGELPDGFYAGELDRCPACGRYSA